MHLHLLLNRSGESSECPNTNRNTTVRVAARSSSYERIGDTFVQLFPLRTAGLIASVGQLLERLRQGRGETMHVQGVQAITGRREAGTFLPPIPRVRSDHAKAALKTARAP